MVHALLECNVDIASLDSRLHFTQVSQHLPESDEDAGSGYRLLVSIVEAAHD